MPRSTPADQFLRSEAIRGGLQRHVGHPLQRNVPGRVGERAPVRSAQSPIRASHVPVELVPDENAVPDDVELLGGDALVVIADRGEPVLDHPVAGDVHDRTAVAQGAELVQRGEAVPA